MIKVTQYLRKPGKNSHSIERIFEDVRTHINPNIQVNVCQNAYLSQGFFGRVIDLFRVCWYQGDINHVTGDIHYVTYLLRKKLQS